MLYLRIFFILSAFAYAEVISYDFDDISVVNTSSPVPANVAGMRQRILEQDERIDGLTTIIEGLSASLNELRSSSMNTSNVSRSNNVDMHSEVLQKLANMIDEINENYITRKEVVAMLENQKAIKVAKKIAEKKSLVKEVKKDSTKNKNMATLYSEGVRHFFKKRYNEAKKRFLITDKKGHKPAASNYYLGEIAYYTKEYSDAVFYFKKSAGLYGEASYMDTLLLHTAISLAKTGETGQARAFFENIIATYPSKKTAKIAQDKLKTL